MNFAVPEVEKILCPDLSKSFIKGIESSLSISARLINTERTIKIEKKIEKNNSSFG